MITKQQKQEKVATLVEKFKASSVVYLINFERLTVAETTEFRRKLKAKEIEMIVAKNTLVKIAAKEVGGFDIPNDLYFGQTAILFSDGSPSEPAKIIKEYFDKIERPALKAAVVEGVVYDNTKLKELSTLPTREDMIAGIIGSIHAPISGIVGSVNAVMRDLANVIEEVAKKQSAA
jgi:large subunit ribosomal protein L10